MEDKQRRLFCWSPWPDARVWPVFLGSPLMIWTRCPAVTKVQSSACRLPAPATATAATDAAHLCVWDELSQLRELLRLAGHEPQERSRFEGLGLGGFLPSCCFSKYRERSRF